MVILMKKIFKDLFVKEKYKIFRIIICSVLAIAVVLLAFFASGNKYIVKIDYKKYVSLYNGDEKSVVVFARKDCSHCKDYMPLLNRISSEKKIVINYFDVSLLTDEDYDNAWKSIPNFKNILDEENNPVIPTPITVILQKGNLVGYLEGDVPEEILTKFLTENGIID